MCNGFFIFINLLIIVGLCPTRPLRAATFFPVTVGDLIDNINSANGNNEDDEIDLGAQLFSLPTIDNTGAEGDNGLPLILSDSNHLLVIKNGTIERSSAAEAFFIDFRLIQITNLAYLKLERVTLRNGFSPSINGGGDGGAVLNLGTLEITETTFNGNGGFQGGAIANKGKIIKISASTLSNNYTGGGPGGGIYNSGEIEIIENTTFTGNQGFEGGGIHNQNIITTIANSTIHANLADGTRAAGLLNRGVIVRLVSSIVAGNTAISEPDLVNEGSLANASYNLIGVAGPGSGNAITTSGNNKIGTVVVPLEPLLDPLANNGGPTETLSLQELSPAIDAGANTLNLLFDQRGTGFARESGGATDIGSFERQILAPIDDDDEGLGECDNCPNACSSDDDAGMLGQPLGGIIGLPHPPLEPVRVADVPSQAPQAEVPAKAVIGNASTDGRSDEKPRLEQGSGCTTGCGPTLLMDLMAAVMVLLLRCKTRFASRDRFSL